MKTVNARAGRLAAIPVGVLLLLLCGCLRTEEALSVVRQPTRSAYEQIVNALCPVLQPILEREVVYDAISLPRTTGAYYNMDLVYGLHLQRELTEEELLEASAINRNLHEHHKPEPILIESEELCDVKVIGNDDMVTAPSLIRIEFTGMLKDPILHVPGWFVVITNQGAFPLGHYWAFEQEGKIAVERLPVVY